MFLEIETKTGDDMKTMILIFVVGLALSGCANVQQAVDGYSAAAMVSIQAAENTNINLWKANACGTPLSAAIRHPEIIPALKALCIPTGDQSNPATLLNDAMEARK